MRVIAALAALAVFTAVADRADARAPRCAGASSAPAAFARAQAVDATICLINVERRRRSLRPVRAESRLARGARRYAADMVARGFFSHVTPDGSTMTDRLAGVGYITRRCTWHVGETLAWGFGAATTPVSRVRAWMHSPPHRAVLVNPIYRDVGVGIAAGRPDGAGDGATYAAEFGRRTSRR